jgi:hypothetical protein
MLFFLEKQKAFMAGSGKGPRRREDGTKDGIKQR